MKRVTAIILLIITGIFFISAGVISLLTWQKTKKRNANVITSPYFTRWVCANQDLTDVTTLPAVDDPLRISYKDSNYCFANAPRCQITAKIADKFKMLGDGDITDEEFKKFLDPEKDLRPLVDFYVDYVDRCGYAIGEGESAVVGDELPKSPDDPNPNSDDLKYGPNDQFFDLLIAICNNQLGKEDASCKALQAKYPSKS